MPEAPKEIDNRFIDNEFLEKLKQLCFLMKKHDWFYEKSDDHKQWFTGDFERIEIYMLLIRGIIQNFVPKELQEQFLKELVNYKKP